MPSNDGDVSRTYPGSFEQKVEFYGLALGGPVATFLGITQFLESGDLVGALGWWVSAIFFVGAFLREYTP